MFNAIFEAVSETALFQMTAMMLALELKDGMQGAVLGFALSTLLFFIVVGLGSTLSPRQRRRFSTRYRPGPDLTDPAQQLPVVMAASFTKQRVLNHEEYRIFKVVEAEAVQARNGYRVLAQTNLGEILKSSNENARHSINSKRVDILVIDRGGWPILAIEYQGSGHYQGNAAARDAVKKEALRKAEIRYLEFARSDGDEQIRLCVREQLGWKNDTSAAGKSAVPEDAVPAQ